jgi:hypothetical protein
MVAYFAVYMHFFLQTRRDLKTRPYAEVRRVGSYVRPLYCPPLLFRAHPCHLCSA